MRTKSTIDYTNFHFSLIARKNELVGKGNKGENGAYCLNNSEILPDKYIVSHL